MIGRIFHILQFEEGSYDHSAAGVAAGVSDGCSSINSEFCCSELFWTYDFPVESIIREPRFGRFVDSKGSSTLLGFDFPRCQCL